MLLELNKITSTAQLATTCQQQLQHSGEGSLLAWAGCLKL